MPLITLAIGMQPPSILIPMFVRIIMKYINWDLKCVRFDAYAEQKKLVKRKTERIQMSRMRYRHTHTHIQNPQICIIWLHVYLYAVDRFLLRYMCELRPLFWLDVCVQKNRTTKNECVVHLFSRSFVFCTANNFFTYRIFISVCVYAI